jgi:hypothetical protein
MAVDSDDVITCCGPVCVSGICLDRTSEEVPKLPTIEGRTVIESCYHSSSVNMESISPYI